MIARSPNLPSSAPWTLGRGQSLVAERVLGVPAWVLLTQLFIGLGWLRAAAEKLIESSWWNGSGITTFLADHSAQTLGWYRPVADNLVAPNAAIFAAIVIAAQLVAAVSLLSGRAVGYGLLIGMFMNVHFLAAGAVSPSVFYLLSQGAVALWIAEKAKPGRRIAVLLSVTAVGAYVFGAMSLPHINTIHPAEVIEDPGIMFVLVAILTVVGCDVAHRRISGGKGLPALSWFLRTKDPT